MTRTVVVLGSTGSIGTQALSVISDHRDRFRVAALGSSGTSVAQFAWQLIEFGAEYAAIADPAAAGDLRPAIDREAARRGLGPGRFNPPRILAGPAALAEIAGLPCDVVLNAVSGPSGLPLTLAALAAGRTVALADNESLVVGGRLVTDRAVPGQIVPVDPGHAALAQCLRSGEPGEVRRLVLTAAGGPFRGRRRAQLASVTPREALSQPARSLGPVSSVNQATLVNKGLELIEAHLLFGVAYDDIEVLIHPQGVVHSMVEFVDGATIAQLSPPETGLSLLWALAWPERVAAVGAGLDWTKASALTFTPLDEEHYPAVALAGEVGRVGGSAPAVYHAANEECVAAFLAGRIKFPQIVDTVARVLAEHTVGGKVPSLGEVQAAQQWARARAREHVGGSGRRRPGLPPLPVGGPARYARRVLLASARDHHPDPGPADPGRPDPAGRSGGRRATGFVLPGRGDPDQGTGTRARVDSAALGTPAFDCAAADRTGQDRAARQRAEFDRVVQDVALEADLVIVVGSAQAADSIRLVDVALDAGAAAYLVDDAGKLDPRWFDGVGTVGVTSAASTPPELVAAVLARLAASGYGHPAGAAGPGRVADSVLFARPAQPRVGR
ncbi:MAG TPA: 1-deoxy-D-xylulose-5-phosphate reductoisomerase [Actinocrinis sp.]|nr:1-deoxy-D-xylulose-5-phosphate reductoisomerase [Actinocrinis sp.]